MTTMLHTFHRPDDGQPAANCPVEIFLIAPGGRETTGFVGDIQVVARAQLVTNGVGQIAVDLPVLDAPDPAVWAASIDVPGSYGVPPVTFTVPASGPAQIADNIAAVPGQPAWSIVGVGPVGPEGPEGPPGPAVDFRLGSAPSLITHTGTKYWSYPAVHGTGVQSAGTLHCVPFWVPAAVTLDRIGAEVTSAAASSTISLGIYNDTGAGLPGALLVDAGTINGNSATAQELTINQALLANRLYWLASLTIGGTPTARIIAASTVWTGSASSLGTALGSNSPPVARRRTALVSAALPNPAATTDSTSSPPLVAVRTT